MKKKTVIIALATVVAICVIVAICLLCTQTSRSEHGTSDNKETIVNTETNPGNENSDHEDDDSSVTDNSNDTDDSNDLDNGTENNDDDKNVSDEETNENIADDVVNNTTGSNDDNDETDSEEDNNTSNGDGNDNPMNPYESPVVIGFGLYVCESGNALPYTNGQIINGVETVLKDGRTIYNFGNYEAMYIASIEKGEITSGLGKGKYFTMNSDFSDNLVECYGNITRYSDGTYSGSMSAYYINTTTKELVYYTAPIYRCNDDVYLVVNNNAKPFKNNEHIVSSETVYACVEDVKINIYTYFVLGTEMYNDLYNGFEIVFYDFNKQIVGSSIYTNNNLPNEIVWSAEAYTAEINLQYDGETLLTITRNRRNIEKSNKGYDWDTVIDGVCYHHHISWILEN